MWYLLEQLAKGINRLNTWVGHAVSWLSLGLVLLVCFDVVVRYLFSDTQAWIMELEWHFFALIFLLGAGFAFFEDRHVRVDLFYARFGGKDKALVNLIGIFFLLIPWCIVLIYAGFNNAFDSWQIREGSPDPGGLPARYVIKFAIVIGITLLLLQGISNFITSLSTYRQMSLEEGSPEHPLIEE